MNVQIRAATRADIPAMESISSRAHLNPLYQALIPAESYDEFVEFYTPSRERTERFTRKIEHFLASETSDVFVAEAEGTVVGMTFYRYREGELGLRGLFVDPAWQGQGIGKRLFEASLEPARSGDTLRLSVLSFNQRARTLYERYGFRETGLDKPFFGAKQIVMTRTQD